MRRVSEWGGREGGRKIQARCWWVGHACVRAPTAVARVDVRVAEKSNNRRAAPLNGAAGDLSVDAPERAPQCLFYTRPSRELLRQLRRHVLSAIACHSVPSMPIVHTKQVERAGDVRGYTVRILHVLAMPTDTCGCEDGAIQYGCCGRAPCILRVGRKAELRGAEPWDLHRAALRADFNIQASLAGHC